MVEFMELTEEQLNSLGEEIYKCFPEQDKLTFFLKDLDEDLLLRINYNNQNILFDNYLDSLNIYSQNEKKYKLLIVESYQTKDIDFEREYNAIISRIHDSQSFLIKKDEDYSIVKKSIDMQEALSNKKYEICHILGHGNNGIILTEKNEIKPEELKEYVKHLSHYKCFILNFCSSHKIAEQISQHVDYVIGMSQIISDEVAIKFAEGFYLGLTNGIRHNQDIFLRGFREGIQAIRGDKNSQYNIPILYISYKRAILNLIKRLDNENKIDYFLEKLKNHGFISLSLHKFISYYKNPFIGDELKVLKNIITNKITDSFAVSTAYQKIFPDEIQIDKNTVIDKLVVNDDKKSETPLIVDFAIKLADILEGENAIYKEIRDWSDSILKRLGIVKPANNEDVSKQQKVKADLWIIVEDEGDKLRLEASVMEKGKNIEKDLKALKLPDCEEEKGITCDSFKDIPFKLDEVINVYEKNSYELRTTTVELFLPMRYIEENIFHDWLKGDNYSETMTCSLIRENKIRIHLHERLKKEMRYHLEQRYEGFYNRISEQSYQYIVKKEIFDIEQHVGKQDVEKIANELQNKIGVKLCNKYKRSQKTHFFSAILKAGTVLVFWLRSSVREDMSLDSIEEYLTLPKDYSNNKNEIFNEIIEKMHNFIKNANVETKPKEHLGYHLGFLCDTPNRIPKIKSLKKFSKKS